MYRDWNFFEEEAKKVVETLGYKITKITTGGLDKGRYRATLNSQTPQYEQFIQSHIEKGKAGFDFKPYSNMAGDDKAQALERLINQTASSLRVYYVQNNKQPISEIFKYFQETKSNNKDNLYYPSKFGRNVYDYFLVITGELNLDSSRRTNFKGDLVYKDNQFFETTTSKELYFEIKSNAKKEWFEENKRNSSDNYQFKNVKIDSFIFDEENIPEIAAYESKFENKISTPQKVKISLENLVNVRDLKNNNGVEKVGFSSNYFSKTQTVVGREKKLIFPNNDVRKSYFLVVELDEIIASHNEKTFVSSKDYPTNDEGKNINDRNYEGDKNAQAKVISVAQNLIPEIIISTSATASGTPIITIDGIVVSGNNRIMSLKLAKSDYPENYENYKKVLFQELEYGGYDISKSQIYPEFKAPVLVRLDAEFPSYETTELNKYNQSRSKTERSIDMTIRVQDKLENSTFCNTQLLNLVSELEIVSELYNNPEFVKRFKRILLDCNLITENDISNLFTDNSLSENGKNFYDNLLLAMVLDRSSLEVSQKPGIKSFIKNIVNAVLPLVKNKTFEKGNISNEINNAVLIQNAMVNGKYTDLADFAREKSMFEEDEVYKTEKAYILAFLLNDKANSLKNALNKYNESLDQNQGESLFGDPMNENEIFDLVFKPLVPEKLLKSIAKTHLEKSENNEIEKITNFSSKELLILRIDNLEKTAKYVANKDEVNAYIKKLKTTLKYIR